MIFAWSHLEASFNNTLQSMNFESCKKFFVDPKVIFQDLLLGNNCPYGIYEPSEFGHENLEIFGLLYGQIDDFLQRSVEDLKLENLYFYILDSGFMTACADRSNGFNFIAISKGLLQFSYLIICSIFKEEKFLHNILGFSTDCTPQFKFTQFNSFYDFIEVNNIDWTSVILSSENYIRRSIAKAVFEYFVLFVISHEVQHLNQRLKGKIEISRAELKENQKLISQIYEWDCDLFGIEQVVTRMMNCKDASDIEKLIIYSDKQRICCFSILIPLLYFYTESYKTGFKPYTLEHTHPHANVRLNYTINYLCFIYRKANFLQEPGVTSAGKRMLGEFKSVMEKIFSDAKISKYFSLSIDPDVKKHVTRIEKLGKLMGKHQCAGF